jgi:hypothetical protein
VIELEKKYMEHVPDQLEMAEKEKELDLRNTSILHYLFERYWLFSFRKFLFRTSDLPNLYEIMTKWQYITPYDFL